MNYIFYMFLLAIVAKPQLCKAPASHEKLTQKHDSVSHGPGSGRHLQPFVGSSYDPCLLLGTSLCQDGGRGSPQETCGKRAGAESRAFFQANEMGDAFESAAGCYCLLNACELVVSVELAWNPRQRHHSGDGDIDDYRWGPFWFKDTMGWK